MPSSYEELKLGADKAFDTLKQLPKDCLAAWAHTLSANYLDNRSDTYLQPAKYYISCRRKILFKEGHRIFFLSEIGEHGIT
jgi:hypothetical protein